MRRGGGGVAGHLLLHAELVHKLIVRFGITLNIGNISQRLNRIYSQSYLSLLLQRVVDKGKVHALPRLLILTHPRIGRDGPR